MTTKPCPTCNGSCMAPDGADLCPACGGSGADLSATRPLLPEPELAMPDEWPDGKPLYWRNEKSGRMKAAVEAWVADGATPAQAALVREYCRHWILCPGFAGPAVERLRLQFREVLDEAALRAWLVAAMAEGVDPLGLG